jgi:hypothetical protein
VAGVPIEEAVVVDVGRVRAGGERPDDVRAVPHDAAYLRGERKHQRPEDDQEPEGSP